MKLKSLKKGTWFTKKSIAEPNEMQVWIKQDYDRESKKYCCVCFGDINKWQYIKGDTEVYTEFTF